MNTLILNPTDTFFARDGRPMAGSLSGHGDGWPLPTVINHAFHAALHRAGFRGVHRHAPGHASKKRDRSAEKVGKRGRKFGSLTTAGPFPVCREGDEGTERWYFPRPLDAGHPDTIEATFLPLSIDGASSLPKPLRYAVANTRTPSKEMPARWLERGSFADYLSGAPSATGDCIDDERFADTEFTFGIGIDPATHTQDKERFYSASYLRLRENWGLGVLAKAEDKGFRHDTHGNDLIQNLLNTSDEKGPCHIVAGGQQRTCTAEASSIGLPLPLGLSDGFTESDEGRWLVKWVLLSPAVWPEIAPESFGGQAVTPHPGGHLPNWIAADDGHVLLLDGPGHSKAKRKKLQPGKRIDARLVATMCGKPVTITGFAQPNAEDEPKRKAGPKSTHLAVPAGSVYYFDAASKEAAQKLAAALNWHGAAGAEATTIHNHRSTLMGEKGLGLGVCGTWSFHSGKVPTD